MATTLDEPTLLHRDASLCAVSWRGIFIEAWFSPGSLPQFRAVYDSHMRCVRAHAGHKIAHLTVVHGFGISGLDATALRLLDERNRAIYPHTSRSATVIPKTGFAAAIVRSIVTSLTQLARPPYPYVVAASLDEALTFLATPKDAPAPPYSVEELRRTYEQMRPA